MKMHSGTRRVRPRTFICLGMLVLVGIFMYYSFGGKSGGGIYNPNKPLPPPFNQPAVHTPKEPVTNPSLADVLKQLPSVEGGV
jgi:hypothetical protein